MTSPAQIRMARAALKIGVRELAELASVTTATITRYENERGGLQAETRDKIQRALEAKGIVFLQDSGQGGGVRLTDRSDAK